MNCSNLPWALLTAPLVDAGDWSPITGDSFSLQSTRGIDYCSTHMWVDDWAVAPVRHLH